MCELGLRIREILILKNFKFKTLSRFTSAQLTRGKSSRVMINLSRFYSMDTHVVWILPLKNSGGNRDDEWTFCRGQEANIALFLQETRIRKIRKIFEENSVDYFPVQGGHEPWNTETSNKVDRNAPITSKLVFPKRSATMIEGTEKPKIPSKFPKRAAGYNEFGYKDHVIEECEGSQSLQWKNFEQSRVILSFVFVGQAGRDRCIQPSSQAFSAWSFLESTMSCDVTERYSPRTRSLARSLPDFARTMDQEETPRN